MSSGFSETESHKPSLRSSASDLADCAVAAALEPFGRIKFFRGSSALIIAVYLFFKEVDDLFLKLRKLILFSCVFFASEVGSKSEKSVLRLSPPPQFQSAPWSFQAQKQGVLDKS